MLDIADFMQTAPRGGKQQGVDQHPRRRQAAEQRRACTPRSCCGCCPSCSSTLPEVGDLDKPKLVFFFDEAHLLFNDAPKALVERIELVVRLVRSKGVGVYFVTQNPLDIPDTVLGPARQPRPARAARVHAARPEGGEGGGEHDARQSRSSTSRRRSPSSPSARRWSPGLIVLLGSPLPPPDRRTQVIGGGW